jgi:hypothetical protein
VVEGHADDDGSLLHDTHGNVRERTCGVGLSLGDDDRHEHTRTVGPGMRQDLTQVERAKSLRRETCFRERRMNSRERRSELSCDSPEHRCEHEALGHVDDHVIVTGMGGLREEAELGARADHQLRARAVRDLARRRL